MPVETAASDSFRELAVLREFVEASKADIGLRSAASMEEATSEVTRDFETSTAVDTRARAHVQHRAALRRRRDTQEQLGVDLRRLHRPRR